MSHIDNKTREYFNNNTFEYGTKKLKYVFSFIKNNLNSSSNIIDIGSILEKIKNECNVFDLYAMDIAQSYLELAVNKINCKKISGSILDDTIVDKIPERFDCALLSEVLHHLVGKTRNESFNLAEKAIKNALNLLKPGGFLIIHEISFEPKITGDIIFYSKRFFSSFTKNRLDLFVKGFNPGEPVVSFLSYSQLKKIINSAENVDIIDENIEKNNFHPIFRLIAAQKKYRTTFVIKKI